MANADKPFGFKPVRHLSGAPYNGQFNLYEIAAGDTAVTMIGDLVKAGDDAATDYYPAVERYGASGEVTSGAIIGAIVGFVVAVPSTGSISLDTPFYRAASTKRFAMVADAEDLIFEVQDGATTATAIASIGLNTGVLCTAGSTVTGLSNMTTGTTAATTTNTLPLRIVGMVNRPDNERAAAYQKLLVTINSRYSGNLIAGV